MAEKVLYPPLDFNNLPTKKIDTRTLYRMVKKDAAIGESDFNLIMTEYHKLKLRKIHEGHMVSFFNSLGILMVIRKDRKDRLDKNGEPILTVNFGESNKRKAALLAEGKELYNHETKTGNKWLVYIQESYYFTIRWWRPNFWNASHYIFKPTQDANELIQKYRSPTTELMYNENSLK